MDAAVAMRPQRDDSHIGAEAPLHGEETAVHEAADEAEAGAFAEADGEMPAGDDTLAGESHDEAQFQDRQDHDRGDQQGDRRRRRRGRRGGRRNRHERDRNGDNGHEFHGRSDAAARRICSRGARSSRSTSEPELSSAVADLDAAPQEAAAPPPVLHDLPHEAPFEAPVTAQAAEAVVPPAMQPEQAPRRRSTVREAVPVSVSEEGSSPVPAPSSAPEPTPVITEIDEGEASRPRRTGWWSRRSADG